MSYRKRDPYQLFPKAKVYRADELPVGLTARSRRAAVLRLEGRTLKQIAVELGVQVPAVSKLLGRARKAGIELPYHVAQIRPSGHGQTHPLSALGGREKYDLPF